MGVNDPFKGGFDAGSRLSLVGTPLASDRE